MNSKLKLEFEHFTINEMPKLKIEDIKSVYIGKPYACRCGCSGVYYYPQVNKELAGEDRGYQVEDDEINDEKVMRVYNKLVKFAKNGIDVQISLNKEYIFTIVIGKKEYSLKNCKHTNVIFVSKITRYIPEGWEELEAKEDVDLEDYETSGKYFAVVCEDCGEILDENIF